MSVLSPDLKTMQQKAREELRSSIPAREALLQEEAAASKGAPYSVTFKQRLAPSGCKNDFVSVGPYWWPDPSAPDGRPYIRRDGMVNPEVLEFDGYALRNMVADVTRLLLVGRMLEKREAFDRAAFLLRTWFLNEETRMNPHLEYGQAIPGLCSGRGIGLIDTASLCGMLWQLSAGEDFPGWTAEDEAGLRKWFTAYLDWMLTSSLGKDESREHNNHGTWYDAQVCSYAAFVGDSGLVRKQIEDSLCSSIMSQIAGGGSMPHELARTLPVHYSLFNLQGFLMCAIHGRGVGIDVFHHGDGIGERLTSAAKWFCRDVFPRSDEASLQLRPLKKNLVAWSCARLGELAGDGPWRELSGLVSEFAWEQVLYRHMRTDDYLVKR